MTEVEARAFNSADVDDIDADRIAASTRPINPVGKNPNTKLRKNIIQYIISCNDSDDLSKSTFSIS